VRIDASSLSLSATHDAHTRDESSETLRMWIGNNRPDFEGVERNRLVTAPSAVTAISEAARIAAHNANSMAVPQPHAANMQGIDEVADGAENDPQLYLIRLMVEMMTGRKIRLITAADMQVSQPTPDIPQQASQQAPDGVVERAGFGVEYDSHHIYTENEHTVFQAQGTVRTADGKEVTLTINLAMSRSYSEESSQSFRAGDGVKKDPLVINFGGTAAQLQNQRFNFDLDNDGHSEELASFVGNSGYLMLDLNGNGKADSGRELFGAMTGNGFEELAQYDGDHNDWIDENDAVFNLLQVWRPDEKGVGSISTLQSNGVGALSLTHVASPFALKDSANLELGAVHATAIYLAESGTVGTMQQIDLIV